MSARHPLAAADAAQAAELLVSKARLRSGHDRMAFELVPMLAALELLANSQRVLRDVEDAARVDGELQQRLCRACPSWGDPIDASLRGFDVVNDLARVARFVALSIAAEVDPDAGGNVAP